MTRWLWALLFALTMAQGAWGPALSFAGDCAKNCPDERSDGDCPATCELCACCSAVRPILLVRAAAPTPPGSVGWVWIESGAILAAPDPREILHVPEFLA